MMQRMVLWCWLMIAVLGATAAHAQTPSAPPDTPPKPQLHFGYKVEFVNSTSVCLGAPGVVPVRGTIKSVNPKAGQYVIETESASVIRLPFYYQDCRIRRVDGVAGKPPVAPVQKPVPPAPAAVKPTAAPPPAKPPAPAVRPPAPVVAAAGSQPSGKPEKLRVDTRDTVLADRPLADCGALNIPGRNGQAITKEIAKKVITCLTEKPSPTGEDGAVRVDIKSVDIGSPRARIRYRDPDGDDDAQVYPVHVVVTSKYFYRRRNVEYTDQEGFYACLVDVFGFWRCGEVAGTGTPGIKREIEVVP